MSSFHASMCVLAHLASGHKHENTPDTYIHKRVSDSTRSSSGFFEIPSGHASPTNNAIRHRTRFLPARVSLSLTAAIRFLTGPFLAISKRNEPASHFHAPPLVRGWVFDGSFLMITSGQIIITSSGSTWLLAEEMHEAIDSNFDGN